MSNQQNKKAYIARSKWEIYALVVFAETAGKARAIAYGTDEMEDASFTDIYVHRAPDLDKYYDGRRMMDWDNDADRLVLVREMGFYCEEPDDWMCNPCIAKEYCTAWKEMQEWDKELWADEKSDVRSVET